MSTTTVGALARGSPDGVLRAECVSASFDGVDALSEVELELRSREILGLIGPNGAGKTTLVNVVSGYVKPQSGRVWMGGDDVTKRPPDWRARSGVARTFQGGRLFPKFTVVENIEAAAIGCRATRKQARIRASEAMELLELGRWGDELAETLPYGEQRRVSLARSVATRPRFLLLDEPAAGLDEAEGRTLGEAVRHVQESMGCGVLLIEHDVDFIMSLAERIQVLDHGVTIAVGTPEAIRSNERVVEAYLGD